MYIYQASGNNIARQLPPPLYRANWGFSNGAQNDIFAAGSAPAPTTYLDNAYATGTGTKTTAAPTATATSLPSGWTALGCMVDSPDTRALDAGSTSSDNMTIESCVASCAAKGFPYAGVECTSYLLLSHKLTSRRCRMPLWFSESYPKLGPSIGM